MSLYQDRFLNNIGVYYVTPPINRANQCKWTFDRFNKKILPAILLASLSQISSAEGFTYHNTDTATDRSELINVPSSGSQEYDFIDIEHTPPIKNSQFTVAAQSNSKLHVSGKTSITLTATEFIPSSIGDEGNYALAVYSGADVELDGDVDIFIYQKNEKVNPDKIGANGIWLQGGDTEVNIGDSSTSTKIWTFALKPDTLQAKGKSQLNIKSTNNQIVGNILIEPEASVSANFVGNGYFYGDNFLSDNPNWVGWVGDFGESGENARPKYEQGDLNVSFENGAQWIYLKKPKISEITLKNNGVVNLFDQDIQEFYTATNLREYLSDDILNFDHKYVHVQNLLGTGGIFKMDLNAEDKAASDVLFIDSYSATDGSTDVQHKIDLVAHDLGLLESITPTNTLIFAVTDKPSGTADTKANSSQLFVDKVNERGEGLVDYELQINHSEMTAADADREEFSTITALDPEDYVGGTKWFIERIEISKSSAALGMSGAGYASYDAAVEMDRRDRRLLETVRSAENDLWVRIHHGRSGAENQYRWDRTGVTIGFDRVFSEKSRAGAWFSYTEGDTEFLDVRGDGDMKRYELAVFDTLTYGNHYLDFVGRIGRVSNEYTVGNEAYATDGDYDQDYAALSAEYGYTLKSETGVFVEPQVQFQVAYLDSFDYRTDRGMKVEADSETSTIGRIGFRAGREFRNVDNAGELYFRGDVLHQFTDGQDAVLSDGLHTFNENWGDTGTWANFGVGAVWSWKDRFQFQFDAERVAGGKTADTWLLSGRVNYLF